MNIHKGPYSAEEEGGRRKEEEGGRRRKEKDGPLIRLALEGHPY